ncbi:hypothetical protein [Embleya sp. NPDC005971]|uniref:RipA family octameric membrane protein n=1 Tax=Embleya sp. NPDC005971 TaxID=3156724 RepID=UPI0033EF27E8
MDDALWNDHVSPADYSSAKDQYQGAILEQYKLCVEMADRVSSRRNLTNTFFLALNTTVVAGLVTGDKETWRGSSVWVPTAGLMILLTQCLTWFVIMRSYRQLNGVKYAVIGALERRLPAFAYSDAEWGALGEGREWRRYLPLTRVEQWVPLMFGAAYAVGFLAAVL